MKLYRHRISMTIICEDKKLRLHEASMIQSPGPIPDLADVSMKVMDPCVESISVEKSSPLSSKEAEDYLPSDAYDPDGNPNKADKQYKAKSKTDKKVRVKSGLIHQGDFHRAMLVAKLEKHGITVENGKVRKSDIRKIIPASANDFYSNLDKVVKKINDTIEKYYNAKEQGKDVKNLSKEVKELKKKAHEEFGIKWPNHKLDD